MSRLQGDCIQRKWLDGNLSIGDETFKTRYVVPSRVALVGAGGLRRRLIWTVAIRRRWWRRWVAEWPLQCGFHRPGSEFEWLPSVPCRQCLESGCFRRPGRPQLRRDHQFHWSKYRPASRLRRGPLRGIEHGYSLQRSGRSAEPGEHQLHGLWRRKRSRPDADSGECADRGLSQSGQRRPARAGAG